jgi:hypothetical protein
MVHQRALRATSLLIEHHIRCRTQILASIHVVQSKRLTSLPMRRSLRQTLDSPVITTISISISLSICSYFLLFRQYTRDTMRMQIILCIQVRQPDYRPALERFG